MFVESVGCCILVRISNNRGWWLHHVRVVSCVWLLVGSDGVIDVKIGSIRGCGVRFFVVWVRKGWFVGVGRRSKLRTGCLIWP